MQDSTAASLETQVDKKQYCDDQLISIKTSLNLPYYKSSGEFERAYGSITINGKAYEYVKRRVYNDTLEVLCLPNDAKTKLQALGNDIAKTAANGGTSAPDKKTQAVLKLSLPDFFQPLKTYAAAFASHTKQAYWFSNTHLLPAGFTGRQERPPTSMQPSTS
ncbi:MAG TPA: hypothetical protein VM871_10525 [Flavisolibacter sp.]|nr:hypothetical protein [Flavisolibacter sp.]